MTCFNVPATEFRPSDAPRSPSRTERAQGMPDAGRTREPCVQGQCTLRTQATTGQPNQPAFPAQWFTAYTRSPRCAGLVSHRRLGIITQDLMPASGHQDHAISPSASHITRQLMPTRPSHPAPNTRDDREAPLLMRRGTGRNLQVICPSDKEKYFCLKGLTGFLKISPSGKSVCVFLGQTTRRRQSPTSELVNKRSFSVPASCERVAT